MALLRTEYLRHIPVFEDLKPEDLDVINQVTAERNVRKNATVFNEGENGEGFHYVKTGKIKIIKLSADGREHIVNILGAGEVFAEVLLFNQGAYPATAVAMEDSCVGVIRNSELEKVILHYPQIALHIIKVMSKKLLYIQTKVKTMAFSDSYAKIAQTLESLAEQYGRKTERGIEVDMDITRQDIANMVGATRETVSRVFSIMKKDKVLDADERKIIVLDMDSLRDYYEQQI
ncbi:MAG TPA: Crp/Fnr family transcriptional regulator [Patescibacteria group bacterium]|nr:Crp/Fnr family transcriptional regulator [Patescibacteria group bacterium]